MQQVELKSLVSDFKTDFSSKSRVNRKTVADRANVANIAALAMLSDTVSEKNTDSFLAKAKEMKSLTAELGEMTDFLEDLGKRARKG
ncbi:hypothetical protein [Sneathiella glossodoripedis]|uniref:hypothetical protein n=1 Tax=Sneathiella glossodoripedis TaxID=418853 RepID=UPI0004729DDF|nr:hypothetical protein [Sneathiella glossodoripedis]